MQLDIQEAEQAGRDYTERIDNIQLDVDQLVGVVSGIVCSNTRHCWCMFLYFVVLYGKLLCVIIAFRAY